MKRTRSSEMFTEFYDTARYNDVLDERTTLMLHLAASMAIGCYP